MHKLSVLAIVASLAACSPTKQDWMTKFEAVLTERMCAPDFIFVHCYQIDEAGCRALVAPSARTCIAKIADQLPDHMDETLGRKYGEIAGSCVGTDIGSQLETKIRQPVDPKCQDPNAWR